MKTSNLTSHQFTKLLYKTCSYYTMNNIAPHDQMFFCALSLDPLRAYNKEDIILQLPGEWTIFEIDWFSIFDVESKENYGSVIIPDSLNVPPSLIKIVVCITTIQWAWI
jgi:hypothetical protein